MPLPWPPEPNHNSPLLTMPNAVYVGHAASQVLRNPSTGAYVFDFQVRTPCGVFTPSAATPLTFAVFNSAGAQINTGTWNGTAWSATLGAVTGAVTSANGLLSGSMSMNPAFVPADAEFMTMNFTDSCLTLFHRRVAEFFDVDLRLADIDETLLPDGVAFTNYVCASALCGCPGTETCRNQVRIQLGAGPIQVLGAFDVGGTFEVFMPELKDRVFAIWEASVQGGCAGVARIGISFDSLPHAQTSLWFVACDGALVRLHDQCLCRNYAFTVPTAPLTLTSLLLDGVQMIVSPPAAFASSAALVTYLDALGVGDFSLSGSVVTLRASHVPLTGVTINATSLPITVS